MEKLIDLFALFRKGNEVANPELWKGRQQAVTVLVPVLMALVKVVGDFGYGIELKPEMATGIALGIVSTVNFVLTNITSKRAGILPARPVEPAATRYPVINAGMLDAAPTPESVVQPGGQTTDSQSPWDTPRPG